MPQKIYAADSAGRADSTLSWWSPLRSWLLSGPLVPPGVSYHDAGHFTSFYHLIPELAFTGNFLFPQYRLYHPKKKMVVLPSPVYGERVLIHAILCIIRL